MVNISDSLANILSDDCFPTAGSDYEPLVADFTFVSGSANGATMNVIVPLAGDDMGEPDETFIIQITPSTPDMATSVTITIINDDSKKHCYSSLPVHCHVLHNYISFVVHFVFSGDCPDLSAPANGSVSMSGIIVGSTATYSCNAGFTLVGDTVRTCEDDMWTGTEPNCQCKLFQFQDLSGLTLSEFVAHFGWKTSPCTSTYCNAWYQITAEIFLASVCYIFCTLWFSCILLPLLQ